MEMSDEFGKVYEGIDEKGINLVNFERNVR